MSPFHASIGSKVRVLSSPCHPQAFTGPSSRIWFALHLKPISLPPTWMKGLGWAHWNGQITGPYLRELTVSKVQSILDLCIETQGCVPSVLQRKSKQEGHRKASHIPWSDQGWFGEGITELHSCMVGRDPWGHPDQHACHQVLRSWLLCAGDGAAWPVIRDSLPLDADHRGTRNCVSPKVLCS